MGKMFRISVFVVLVAGFLLISCSKDKPSIGKIANAATTTERNRYALDTLNSKIEWKGYKIFKSDHLSHFGTIKFESGEITVKDGKLESGKFVADMKSLESVDLKDDLEQKAKLERHLKSGDFFEIEKFPTASYELIKISYNKNGDYNTILDGNLTIKGITKPVQFNANVSVKDGEVNIATEPKDIKRKEFGITFQIPVENVMIKDEVNVQIFIKALEKN
jgi:polyisoprenoid-binding protein YceI